MTYLLACDLGCTTYDGSCMPITYTTTLFGCSIGCEQNGFYQILVVPRTCCGVLKRLHPQIHQCFIVAVCKYDDIGWFLTPDNWHAIQWNSMWTAMLSVWHPEYVKYVKFVKREIERGWNNFVLSCDVLLRISNAILTEKLVI